MTYKIDKMKLTKGHYWVKSVSMLRGIKNNPHKQEDNNISIAYYYGDKYEDGSKNDYPWNIIGSDERFATYTNDDNIKHGEMHIIPLKRINAKRRKENYQQYMEAQMETFAVNNGFKFEKEWYKSNINRDYSGYYTYLMVRDNIKVRITHNKEKDEVVIISYEVNKKGMTLNDLPKGDENEINKNNN